VGDVDLRSVRSKNSQAIILRWLCVCCSHVSARSFRSSRQSGGMVNLTSVFTMIKEMQRKFKTREAEKKELEVLHHPLLCHV